MLIPHIPTYPVCDPGYFGSSLTLNCELCSQNCQTCAGNSIACTSCAPPLLFYNSSCLASCPMSYFNASTICTQCPAVCRTCTNLTTCQTCQQGNFAYDSFCYSNCPLGFYANTSSSVCAQCPMQCAACSAPSNCSSCSSPFVALGTICVCPLTAQGAHTYLNTTTSQCGTCDSLSYGDPADFVCKACQLPCASCSLAAANCTSCQSGLFLQGNACLSACNAGFYSASNVCTPCNASCLVTSISTAERGRAVSLLSPRSRDYPLLISSSN